MDRDTEQAGLVYVDEGSSAEAELPVHVAGSHSHKLRFAVLAFAGATLVLLGVFMGTDVHTPLREAGIIGLSATDVDVCDDTVKHGCPAGYKVTGGYHCKTHKGCRAEEYGPFPEDDCPDQCRIKAKVEIEECGDTVEHGCPADFAKTGGYHCKKHHGCRYEKEGPFPESSCKTSDQCYIKKEKAEVEVEDEDEDADEDTDSPYDCDEGFNNCKKGWSVKKKAYCTKHGKQCFDCDEGFKNWKKGWSDKKKDWCCKNLKRGCE